MRVVRHAAVVKPLDEDIRNSRFNLTLPGHEDGRLDEVFEPGHILGGFALQVGGAFATYGIGSWIGKPGVTELGRDLVRVQLSPALVRVTADSLVGWISGGMKIERVNAVTARV